MNVSYSSNRKIPAFGNWDYENELPITQYFESARQAGLVRYSNSSGECDLNRVSDFKKNNPSPAAVPPRKTTRRRVNNEKRCAHAKEHRKNQVGRVICDVTELSTRKTSTGNQNQRLWLHHNHHDGGPTPGIAVVGAPKPVDEDLYKISPDLLHYHSKRKKMLGFFPRCLLPPCVV